jgi:hypothetical protein
MGKYPLSQRMGDTLDQFFGEESGTLRKEYREWMISKIHIGGSQKMKIEDVKVGNEGPHQRMGRHGTRERAE